MNKYYYVVLKIHLKAHFNINYRNRLKKRNQEILVSSLDVTKEEEETHVKEEDTIVEKEKIMEDQINGVGSVRRTIKKKKIC